MYFKYEGARWEGAVVQWAEFDTHAQAKEWKDGLDQLLHAKSRVEGYSVADIQNLKLSDIQDMPVWMYKKVMA